MQKEIWKPIEGFEGLYEVSNLGRIKTLQKTRCDGKVYKEKLMKISTNGSYCDVSLHKEGKASHHLVHRLVAKAFIPNPEGLPQVNHIDENKTNNCVENLEWCTAKYNSNYGTRAKRLRAIAQEKSLEKGEMCGVCFVKQKNCYVAYIGAHGKTVFLGAYDTKAEAIASRKGAEALLYSLETRNAI